MSWLVLLRAIDKVPCEFVMLAFLHCLMLDIGHDGEPLESLPV